MRLRLPLQLLSPLLALRSSRLSARDLVLGFEGALAGGLRDWGFADDGTWSRLILLRAHPGYSILRLACIRSSWLQLQDRSGAGLRPSATYFLGY